MNTYYSHRFKKKIVNIDMGEWHISDEDVIIQTVLGSCISVCLYSDYYYFVGMNHFLLPGKVSSSLGDTKYGRYGMYAMELLINGLMKLGVDKYQLKAKVFGGANILRMDNDALNIGKNNIDFVTDYLNAEGIPIISGDVGKDFSRTILFFQKTKKVLLKKNNKSFENRLHDQEFNYSKNLIKEQEEKKESSIILF